MDTRILQTLSGYIDNWDSLSLHQFKPSKHIQGVCCDHVGYNYNKVNTSSYLEAAKITESQLNIDSKQAITLYMQPFQVGLCDNGKTYILINEYVKLGIQNSLMTLHHYRDNISYQDKTVVNDIYSHVVLVIRGEI